EALGVNLRDDTDHLLGLTPEDREFLFDHVCRSSFEEWEPPATEGRWPPRVRVFARQGSVVLFVTGATRVFGVGRLSSAGPIRDVPLYPSLARASFSFRRSE